MERSGFFIIAIFREIGSGWQEDWDILIYAAEYVLANDAVLVVEAVTRFFLNRDYSSKTNWNVLPTVEEYCRLQRETHGVKLAT